MALFLLVAGIGFGCNSPEGTQNTTTSDTTTTTNPTDTTRARTDSIPAPGR